MKKLFDQIQDVARAVLARVCMVFAFVFGLSVITAQAMAQATDIAGTVSSLSGLWTTIQALAIAVILFVIGRKLLKKV